MLSYADRDLKWDLAAEFNVQGIPALVILDSDGSLITTHGKQLILSTPFDKLKEAEAERANAWCVIS